MSTISPVPKDYPREIIGYAEPWIVSPGNEVEIKVSCTEQEYTYRTVRILQGWEGVKSPPAKREEVDGIVRGTRKGRFQIAPIGSYGKVENIGVFATDQGLAISMYVQPWLTVCEHVQSLFSTLDVSTKTGIGIVLNMQGFLEFWVGIGTEVQVIPVGFLAAKKRWLKIDLVVSGTAIDATLTPQSHGTEPYGEPFVVKADLGSAFSLSTSTPLIVAASYSKNAEDQEQASSPTNKYNGRIDTVRIDAVGEGQRTLLELDFAVEMASDSIIDISGNGRDGILVNAPSRAMKGHNWDGTVTDWTKAKYGYGAIHFHEDDLDDACWETDLTIKLPEDARSGVYGVEITAGGVVGDTVIFFVRPTQATTSRIGAKVAVVLSTFTYLSYANEHLFDPNSQFDIPEGVDNIDIYKDETFHKMDRRRDLGLAHYDVHKDFSAVMYSSAKRPILNCRPDYVIWTSHRPRELSADLLMVGYLEKLGIPYDIVTDHDLHTGGVSALSSYTTAITGCHPEYPTLQSYTAWEDFVKQGGNMMYLGGNGFYWVSVTDADRPWRSEVRRGGQGVRTAWQEPGERMHSLNGQLGGLWRDYGKAANYLLGVGCCGEGTGGGVAYRRKDNLCNTQAGLVSWMFKDIPEGELLGENSLGALGGGASADEIDRMDFTYGSPSNIVVVASSIGHPDQFGLFPEDVGFPMMKTLGTQTDLIRSDMTYYETAGGGAVFSVGSISWYCALGWDNYNNNIALLTRNVLLEFLKGKRQ
ncbi:N,N-dimethylformamidase heavy chain [Hyphodiscus hymeniophilus]|uniref:N,N-dimethylformamidase heavy chain n=1 Tax=Hyphodiscus hymeniophilus TaxID=353542 RepID=A0A9P6VKZ3_9HELO|nr:N,N-dimethylformamidase heavy chain [Hyphodiscus hymeniophilus]